MTSPVVTKPVFEHHHNGLGLGHSRPRISWRFQATESTSPGWTQTAYEVEITLSNTGKPELYRVVSDESVLVPWPAASLKSRQSASVRVRCYGKTDTQETGPTEWSSEANVEVGLLEQSDWTASFISSSKRIGPDGPLQPLRFRKEFTLPAGQVTLSKARLYITSLGVFDVYINGRLASDECLAPGWTSYNHRLNYRVLDVASFLSQDKPNSICVEVGEGWYATRLGFKGGKRFCYGGTEVAMLAQLEVDFGPDRETWKLVSDDLWSCAASAIQSSELYDGEVYDMRQEQSDWKSASPKSDIAGFTTTKALPWPKTKLVSPDAPPVKVTETKTPHSIFKSKSGKTIIDFGQNLVGKLQIKSLYI
ncbi:hypothetical protein LIPSTDRAFT_337760 [Lipomyces starkeyi NRRL Y-11557]|uniref:Bacterial alpha-L-rhamnosidase N-terminal domain-containing protein n=1 Tax=Lipomyces starkeyi NRRL Y-11557 TaxID=675824 RepID=A0A1E3Q708_LIPST|nr:hypothetical protein LIPSTDRAFT_337760 [Lipomyces starkeyi NRRL Y-11557]